MRKQKIMKVELVGRLVFDLDVLEEGEEYTDEQMKKDFLPDIKDLIDEIETLNIEFSEREIEGKCYPE